MCGPIRSCKCGSTNWLINMLDINKLNNMLNLLKAIIKNLVLFDLPTLAFLSRVLKSVVLLKVEYNSQSVYECLRSLLLTLINSYVYMYVYIYVYVYIYMYVYICFNINIYIHNKYMYINIQGFLLRVDFLWKGTFWENLSIYLSIYPSIYL